MKRKSLALLMAAITVFSAVGCGSKDAAADTTTAEPAAEETTEASDDAAAADTASDADGFYAGKTVEMIVPWAAGGGADTACRLICSYMEKELGCTIVINNVTGGGGSIGLAQLTTANPDGLTYAYFANTDSNGDIMLEGVPYTAEDFAPVCKFAADPHIILASNASNIISTQIGDMTITGAISLRNRLRGKGAYGRTGLFEKNLEEEMEQELARYEKRCANQNELLSDRAAEMRLSILGKDNKGKQDQFLDVVEAFLKENTVELVDPLHIKKCSEANAARRDELLTELDTKIKVSNATVFVEIEE